LHAKGFFSGKLIGAMQATDQFDQQPTQQYVDQQPTQRYGVTSGT